MIHVHSLVELPRPDCPALLTVGSFDGVHLGHQALIHGLVNEAHQRPQAFRAAVVTFFPHPSVVLRGPLRGPSFYINTPEEKAELLASLGVDVTVTHPFNHDVANITAADFVKQLQAALDFKELWCGADFAFGHNREGTVAWLKEYGDQHGFRVRVIEPVLLGGEAISSSRVRHALADGNVGEAADCLGRPFQLAGVVVEGSRRGRTIGIPTANLRIWDEQAYPARGVYACRAWIAGERSERSERGEAVNAVANIGLRPTFETDAKPTLEAHLLDFDRDLYGQTLRLDFVARLRPEQKFNGVNELVAQIHRDIESARKILKSQIPTSNAQ